MAETKFEVRPVTRWTVTVPGLRKEVKERVRYFFSEEEMTKALPRIAQLFYLKVEDLAVKKQALFGIYFEGERLNGNEGFFRSHEAAERNLISHSDHWNKLAGTPSKTKSAKAGER